MRWVLAAMLAIMTGTVVFVLWRRRAMLGEIWLFLKAEKKWWLTPVLLVLLILMALMIANAQAPIMAFLYPIH